MSDMKFTAECLAVNCDTSESHHLVTIGCTFRFWDVLHLTPVSSIELQVLYIQISYISLNGSRSETP